MAGRGVRFPSREELLVAVRAQCEREYRKLTGRAWEPQLGARFQPVDGERRVARNRLDVRAERVFQELRAAMAQAVDFVADVTAEVQDNDDARTRERIAALRTAMMTAPRAQFLSSWVPRFIAPLMKHSAMETAHRPKLEHDPRALLAYEYSSKDLLGLGRVPTARELATVSLLVGNAPACSAKNTVAQVIAAERRAVALALERHAHPASRQG